MRSPAIVLQALLVLFASTPTAAAPSSFPRVTVSQDHFEVLAMRANTEINPSAVADVRCLDTRANVVFHDQNVAQLAICGGIAGRVTKCGGAPPSTVGRSGSAKFVLTPVEDGAAITISKAHWEGCVRAARAVCPTGSMTATCLGGATSGDVAFTLGNP